MVFITLVPNMFSSCCSFLLLSPLLLLLTPGLGPVLAVWNIVNPDIPIVFWRYVTLAASSSNAVVLRCMFGVWGLGTTPWRLP